ncbi:MAG: bifunctional (p)ppGpp synthetase/guanosine-3',5'-bis(diphosphate) 3'-pyrophosphohydrolase [Clostridia bacterium]|nr:bifunctional (p)ppGpp synthetase/guanosine-3',5'-bis(diphosphate) 3'-pyrophosphohydrolase [Clostridia bacterium]
MQEEQQITLNDLISTIKRNNKIADIKTVTKAHNYALQYHGSQKRKSGEPYIIHPLNVANILAGLGMDTTTVCAALLHDVIEDTKATRQDLIKEFGKEVTEIVDGVTKLQKLQYTDKEEQQVENYRKMFLAMGKDIRVILIKLADRLHNMRTLKYLTRDRQLAISKETMDLYAPLANRIGMYSLKWELEDLSFKYLYPDEYREILEGLNEKREERLDFVDKIKKEITIELKKTKIVADTTGRAKHIYSIYRKMQRDGITLEQVYDLFALRIIVNSVKDCYAALGVVHDLYNPMPGRFKDYIAVPKANMYQSLHTTLIGPNATPVEVQIRTWDMHRIAEFGIAAHWAYKEANRFKKTTVKVEEDKLSWLRESLEWQREMNDPNEFLNTLKKELFEDEVYVFTKNGEIKVLPKDATPIDFAYSIHTEIGNKMTGCKINSQMMPIVTKLNNGDIVDIITSDNAKGPSRDWLKFVQSTRAKNKIQQWFKKANREENIEKGKELLAREIKRVGLTETELYKQEYINAMLERYKFPNVTEMQSSVGFGAISAGKIVSKLLNEYSKDHKEEELEKKIEELSSSSKKIQGKPTSSGIIVKGIDNCLVKLAKCCNPVPGDKIIGYITKGRGVSVHRSDCININELLEQEDRIIEVAWYEKAKTSYTVNIEIFSNDRDGLLSDIVREFGNEKVSIMDIRSKVTKEKIVITEVTTEIENLETLNKLFRVLRKIDSVYEVKRKN